MNETVKANASKYGLIAAALGISFSLYAYFIDINLFVSSWIGIALKAFYVVIFIISVATTKRAQGSYMTFKEAFTSFITTYLIFSLVTTLFTIALFVYIDPEMTAQVQELIVTWNIEMMESLKMSQEEIDAQLALLEQSKSFTIGSQVKGFFGAIVGYSIVGLVVSAVMKKSEPYQIIEEEQNVED